MTSTQRCKTCDRTFWSEDELREHMILTEHHYKCPACYIEYQSAGGLANHIRQSHPVEHTLPCPAECGLIFSRLAKLIEHLDIKPCRQLIDAKKTLADRRQLPRPFQALTSRVPSVFQDDDGAEASSAVNAWSMDGQSWSTRPLPPHLNPGNRQFDASKFYLPLIKQFRCPFSSCRGKTFKASVGLRAHLSTHAKKTETLICPTCLKLFTSAAAMAGHAEDTASKCTLKHADFYRMVLDQLSGGFVDLDGHHVDGSVKYKVEGVAPVEQEPITGIRMQLTVVLSRVDREEKERRARSYGRAPANVIDRGGADRRNEAQVDRLLSEINQTLGELRVSSTASAMDNVESLEAGWTDAGEFNDMKRMAAAGSAQRYRGRADTPSSWADITKRRH